MYYQITYLSLLDCTINVATTHSMIQITTHSMIQITTQSRIQITTQSRIQIILCCNKYVMLSCVLSLTMGRIYVYWSNALHKTYKQDKLETMLSFLLRESSPSVTYSLWSHSLQVQYACIVCEYKCPLEKKKFADWLLVNITQWVIRKINPLIGKQPCFEWRHRTLSDED